MKINFIGNFQTGPGGEASDERNIATELEAIGNEVRRINRDVWKAYLDGHPQNSTDLLPEKADISIVCKWHHFDKAIYFTELKKLSPVFYWVWDFMGEDAPNWHLMNARLSDLYLSGEASCAAFYKAKQIKFHYFQFDNVSKDFNITTAEQIYDVIFTGSCINKNGRLDLLKQINKEIPIQIFGYDYPEWAKHGFINPKPAFYGHDFAKVIAQSKIILNVSYYPNQSFYWSNRIGKVLYAGGFLLTQYTPGMEQFIGGSAAYFQTAEEAVKQIKTYLAFPERRHRIQQTNLLFNRSRWTSKEKVRQLQILMERFLIENNGKDWNLA